MKELLLSPNGRINKQDFLKGTAIVAIIYAILSILGHFVPALGGVMTFIGLLLFVPFIFLMIKRSHDGGKSGWLSIVWLFIWALIALIFYLIGALLLEGQLLGEYFTAIMEAASEGDTEAQEAIAAEYDPKVEAALGLNMIPFGFIGTMAAAYLINLFTGKDFEENQFGPVA